MRNRASNIGKQIKGFPITGYVKITVLGFATTALWSSLHTIILPVRLLDLVSGEQKNTLLGLITFSGLILAMLTQPLAGYLSDRATFRLGRRRPYIITGIIFSSLIVFGIGLSRRYATLFLTYCLLQVATNTAQGPYQAFIPELVPKVERGRASGVKSALEILGGVALLYPIAFFMDNYSIREEVSLLYLALMVLAVILLGAMAATVILVREPPHAASSLLWPFHLRKTLKIEAQKNSNFIWFLASRLLFFLAFTTIQTFGLYFLRDVTDIPNPATATASLFIVAVSGMLLAVYPAGYISDKLGKRPIGMASGLIGAFGILPIFFFPCHYLVVMLSGGLIGIAFGMFLSASWAWATDLVPAGDEARYLGLTNMATTGGAALARLIGPLIDFFNHLSPNRGYFVMLIICFASLVAGSWLLVKRK